jgi:ammonium transporter, Amt family
LFANGTYGDGLNGVPGPVRGLFHGDSGQLAAAFVGIVANVVYVSLTATAALLLADKLVGNRVAEQDELDGLDLPEMGLEGYSAEFQTLTAVEPAPTISSSSGAYAAWRDPSRAAR